MGVWIVLGVIAAALLFLIGTYSRLVTLRNRIENRMGAN